MPLPSSLRAHLRSVPDPDIALYVHWPFCASKCPYCDFNSHVRPSIDHDLWAKTLIADLTEQAVWLGKRRVTSVFFGGGTPSLMLPKTVEAILSAVQTHWQMAEDAEVTLEANPTSVEASKFRDFRLTGINRVSVGVQSLIDADLKALGRTHTAQEALEAYYVAEKVFGRTSFDLIYARQGQTVRDWEEELGQALAVAGEHLSLYQLTIEPNTRFWELDRRKLLRNLPNSEISREMKIVTDGLCAEAGYRNYEVSNYAQPSGECRHNLTYWRYGEYCGVGPGAHGRVIRHGERMATLRESDPDKYIQYIECNGLRFAEREHLTNKEEAMEYIMMSMRLSEGTSLEVAREFDPGCCSDDRIHDLENMGLVNSKSGRIVATSEGRLVLNSVVGELLAG